MTTTSVAAPRASRRWPPVAYPIVIGTALYLLLFTASGASPYSAIRMVLAAAVVSTIIAIACTAVLRDRDRGALLAIIVIFAIFSGPDDVRLLLVLGLGVAVLVGEAILSRRRPLKLPWPTISRVGNLLAVIAVLAIGIQALQDGTIGAIAYDVRAEGPEWLRPSPAEIDPVAATDAHRPDIVVLLLDGYARADKQEQLLGHDDQTFVDELADRGFEVAEHSRSNYLITAASLASMLNMEHLDPASELASLPSTDLRHVRGARRMINENRVFETLRGAGYRISAVSSGFEELALRQADRFIDTGQLNEVELLTFRHTGAGPFVQAFAPDLFAQQQRDRIDGIFGAAASLGTDTGEQPEFLFVHVPSPHAPVVYDGDGQPVEARDLPTFYEDSAIGRGIDRAEYAEGYSGQVDYLDKKVLELVDTLTADGSDPVILVLSDHGSASAFDFGAPVDSDVDERSANFFAARTPERQEVFEDDGTLVNVFGRLFHAYLGTDWEDLPDTVYGWRNPSIFDVVPIDPDRLSP